MPRPQNPDSDEKDALFGLDTQITINSGIIFQKKECVWKYNFLNKIS
jgi:hypothetical protein